MNLIKQMEIEFNEGHLYDFMTTHILADPGLERRFLSRVGPGMLDSIFGNGGTESSSAEHGRVLKLALAPKEQRYELVVNMMKDFVEEL